VTKHQARILVLPNPEMVTPHFEVKRLRAADISEVEPSYKIELHSEEHTHSESLESETVPVAPKPAVQQYSQTPPASVAPAEKEAKESMFAGIGKFFSGLFGGGEKAEKPARRSKPEQRRPEQRGNRHRKGRGRRNDQNRRQNSDELVSNLDSAKSSPKSGRNERPQRNRGERDGRPNRGEREDRPVRDDKSAQANGAVDKNAVESNDNVDNKDNMRPPKRPADRQGRRQSRRRGPRPDQAVEADNASVSDSTGIQSKATPSEPSANAVQAQLDLPQVAETAANYARADEQTSEAATKQRKPQRAAKPQAQNLDFSSDADEPDDDIGSDAVEPTVPMEEAPVVEQVTEIPEKVDAAPPVSVQKTTVPSKGRNSYTRAANDPRVNPSPVGPVELVAVDHQAHRSSALDTSQAADIQREPRQLQRPSNDPRNARAVVAAAHETAPL